MFFVEKLYHCKKNMLLRNTVTQYLDAGSNFLRVLSGQLHEFCGFFNTMEQSEAGEKQVIIMAP